MKKALYIIEYDNGDGIQSEWFVANDNLNYGEQLGEAYKHLAELNDETVEDIISQHTIESVYQIAESMMLEVTESYK